MNELGRSLQCHAMKRSSHHLPWVVQRVEKEMELLEEQRTKREAAAGANSVMEPIAKRKLRKELQKVTPARLCLCITSHAQKRTCRI